MNDLDLAVQYTLTNFSCMPPHADWPVPVITETNTTLCNLSSPDTYVYN